MQIIRLDKKTEVWYNIGVTEPPFHTETGVYDAQVASFRNSVHSVGKPLRPAIGQDRGFLRFMRKISVYPVLCRKAKEVKVPKFEVGEMLVYHRGELAEQVGFSRTVTAVVDEVVVDRYDEPLYHVYLLPRGYACVLESQLSRFVDWYNTEKREE